MSQIAHTAKSPIIPANEIEIEERSNEAKSFCTRDEDELNTTDAPGRGEKLVGLLVAKELTLRALET